MSKFFFDEGFEKRHFFRKNKNKKLISDEERISRNGRRDQFPKKLKYNAVKEDIPEVIDYRTAGPKSDFFDDVETPLFEFNYNEDDDRISFDCIKCGRLASFCRYGDC